MSLHLVTARTAKRSPVAQYLYKSDIAPFANDNGELGDNDLFVEAALRHFATHGMGAARDAREQAEIAFFEGDRLTYDWWLSVCRILDRRIARELERNTQP